MNLNEYAHYDALGLAELVANKEVTPRELAATAKRALDAINTEVNAVVEIYDDRIEDLDESTLGDGPFKGVPFLIKDTGEHGVGRKIEFGSRLCQGMKVREKTYLCDLFTAAGLNILGRTNTPEYSMSGASENALYGATSTPWKKGYCAGGSSGGSAAAVVAGIVPMAHGTDIAGSIRMPGSWCGGIGLKPSRGRVSFGPGLDENGFGLAVALAQTKSVRDTAAILDCVAIPQTGDPFLIPHPDQTYADLLKPPPGKLKIGWSVEPLMGVATDPEIKKAVEDTARVLEDMGHEVCEDGPSYDGLATVRKFSDVWFFGFDRRLRGYSQRSGHKISPDTLEPVVWHIYQHACKLTADEFLSGVAEINRARRKLCTFYDDYDIWLSPTTPRISEPHGIYNLGRTDVDMNNYVEEILAAPAQFTVPHNIMATPAITLPLAMHSTGLPIGIQLGARFANEHILLALAAALEQALPWKDRTPPLHVSNV